MKPAPALKWPGATWSQAPWVVSHFVPTSVYLETCLGSAAALAHKPPSPSEVANDLDDQVVNFFQVLRDQPAALAEAVSLTPWSRTEWRTARAELDAEATPLERARRFVVMATQSHGHRPAGNAGWRHDGPARGTSVTLQWRALPERIVALAERLRGVQFENRHVLDVLSRYRGDEVLVFHDPPFLGSVRGNRRIYRVEMRGRNEHTEVLSALRSHPGPVAALHYRCDLYDDKLWGWACVETPTVAEHGAKRTLALYLNPILVRRLSSARRQRALFDENGTPAV